MKKFFTKRWGQTPSVGVSLIPLLVLALLLVLVIRAFGSDSIMGGSQIALLSAASVCALLSVGLYGCKWAVLENEIVENIRSSASAIIILLLIGSIAGTVNGLFGAGGGMLLIPLLTLTALVDEDALFPTCVCIMLPICIVSLTVAGFQAPLPLASLF